MYTISAEEDIGAIVGIVFGCIFGALLLGVLVWWTWRKGYCDGMLYHNGSRIDYGGLFGKYTLIGSMFGLQKRSEMRSFDEAFLNLLHEIY